MGNPVAGESRERCVGGRKIEITRFARGELDVIKDRHRDAHKHRQFMARRPCESLNADVFG
jgi:hypothetical protein